MKNATLEIDGDVTVLLENGGCSLFSMERNEALALFGEWFDEGQKRFDADLAADRRGREVAARRLKIRLVR